MSSIDSTSTSTSPRSFSRCVANWRETEGKGAESERQRISRDIHDSTIQPYIGLKFALEALARKVPPDHPLAKDIGKLVDMTTMEIAGLRRYVNGLKGQLGGKDETLGSILEQKAARFAEIFNIKVSVEVAQEGNVESWLADDICHMMGEALSNIRRHTNALFARVRLTCDSRMLTLEIINPRDRGVALHMFTPRSIAERALALGGRCKVETGSGRYTVVIIEILLLP
ncbi:MAG: putative two-component sensor protein [Betaproteobacteria bacterium]|nr:putative two-component sensor protein [Betaproteobacteria bacterium]